MEMEENIDDEIIQISDFNFDIFNNLIQIQDTPEKVLNLFENYIDHIDPIYVSIIYTIVKNPSHVQIIDRIFELCIKHNYAALAIQNFLDAWIDYWTTEPNLLLNYASPPLFNKFKEMLSNAVYHLRDQEINKNYHSLLKKKFKINLECTG